MLVCLNGFIIVIPSFCISSSPKLSWSCFPAAASDSTPESTVDVINSFCEAVIFKSSFKQAVDEAVDVVRPKPEVETVVFVTSPLPP